MTLEETCTVCRGTGEQWECDDSGYHYKCNTCEGRKVVPTEEGEDILRFIRKYLKIASEVST